MKPWWQRSPARLRAELDGIETLAQSEAWFTLERWLLVDNRLAVNGTIAAHGHGYRIRLVYPALFPEVPAWVVPQDKSVRWSLHQYGDGGSLCLEMRPDNWRPSMTGEDLLRSAHRLLDTENPLGAGAHQAVPSAHQITQVQSYEFSELPVLVSAGCLGRLRSGLASAVRALRWPPVEGFASIMISDSVDRTNSPTLSAPLDPIVALPVVVGRVSTIPDTPIDRNTLATVFEDLAAAESISTGNTVVAIALHDTELAIFHFLGDNAYRRKPFPLCGTAGVRSGRSDQFGNPSVAVVGAGSIGSKVAETLLRSGVRQLALVDGDVFLPGNLERHVLDWRDVGYRKVYGLKKRLLTIAPESAILSIEANLNWQRSSRVLNANIQAIAGCSLIIDATADPGTSLLLGAIAHDASLPFISVQVFEGGLGALVARSVPGEDPAFADGRAAYDAYCDERDEKPPRSGQARYDAEAEDGSPISADDAAVTMAAGHAARVALDILDGARGESLGKPWLLLGFRKGWLFGGHGSSIALDVGQPRAKPAEEDGQELQEFVKRLLAEADDAASAAA